ncbi:MAG: diguanylate cyclase [Oscillochloridaceae bacterium]|nr:diguanylate cyclase [Chloroflexaceae bacterium]MDW8388599.1 diguanylate cyclase [Oscillochloridaceae bacterium]
MDADALALIYEQLSGLRAQLERLASEPAPAPAAHAVQHLRSAPFAWELWIGPQGQCRYSSPASSAIIGYTPKELYADPDLLTRCVHYADQDLWARYQRQVLRAEHSEISMLCLRLAHRAGAVRRVLYRCRPFTDPDGIWQGRHASVWVLGEGEFPDLVPLAPDSWPGAQMEQRMLSEYHFIRSVADLLPATVFIFDLTERRAVYANRPLARLLGYGPDEIRGSEIDSLPSLLHPEDRANLERRLEELRDMSDEQTVEHTFRLRHRDGSWRWMRTRGRVFRRDAEGRVCQVLGQIEDVTRQHLYEEQLHYQASLLANVADAVIATDLTFRIQSWNAAAERIYGWTANEVLGRPVDEVLVTRYLNDSAEAALQVLLREGQWRGEVEQRRRDGSYVPIQSSVTLLRNGVERMTGVVAINRDISERRHAERLLQAVNARLEQTIVEARRYAAEVIQINQMHDLLQVCQNRSEAAEVIQLRLAALFPDHGGYLAVRVPGADDLEVICQWGEQRPARLVFPIEDCWALRRGQIHVLTDIQTGPRCRHLGAARAAYSCCLPLAVQSEIYGVLHVAGEAQPRSELLISVGDAIKLALTNIDLREALREQAILDPLTGLFNRRYLEATLPREAHRAQREGEPLCVAMLDIDHFKSFNDRYGHEAGDMLLREVAWIFREHMRKSDIACRYGGEEFVLVLPGSAVEDTVQRLEQIRSLVNALQLDFHGRRLEPISISAGVAAYSGACGGIEELLRAADEALYAAKRPGRNTIVVHG